MKYIIVVEPRFGMELPLVFPEVLDHSTALGTLKPISAGFVSIDLEKKKAFPYGKSITLNLASREADQSILESLLFKDT
jgi:hypothetical protein